VIGPRLKAGKNVTFDSTTSWDGVGGDPWCKAAAVAGWPVVGLAVLVMLGWIVRVPWMVQIIPGTVAMVFSNAFCMFLLGIALVLTTLSHRWCKPVQTAIGIGVLLVGMTVMLQYRLDLALPLDLPGLHSWLNNNPGRMAPNTALAHALSGLTVLLVVHARHGALAVLALIAAFAVTMLGVTGLVGYRLHPELLYGWHVETRMALHTGSAFLVLGIGYAVAAYRTQQLSEFFRTHEDLRVEVLSGALMVFVGLVPGLSAFTLLQEQTESVLRNGLRLSFKSDQDLLVSQVTTLVQATRNFANRPGIQNNLMRLRRNPDDHAARQALDAALDSHMGAMSVSGRLFDDRGRLLASAGSAHDASLVLPLRQEGEAALLWVDQSVSLRTAQPVLAQGLRVGRIELTYVLPAVTQMLNDAREIAHSGEMQLCATGGQAIRCLPMRLTPARTELPSATDRGPTMIARALAAEHGVMLDTDYRGERVIGAYGPVGDLGLGMVLKVDVAEIYAPVRHRLELTLLVIVLIVGTGLLLLRARLIPLVRRLQLSEKQFRGLLESAPDAMLVTDLDGHITWVNSRTERLFGYSQSELIGQAVEILVPESAREMHVRKRAGYARQPHYREVGTPLELYGRRKDGSVFPAEIGLSPQDTEVGVRVISTVRDISERKQAEETIRELSLTDELTGLRNRRGFFTLAEHQLSVAHRLGHRAVLYYADLDGLKRINDEFGHAEGDQAIADAAAILRDTFRESDIIARLGGDEFIVLTLDSSTSDPTSSLARLEQNLAEHNRTAGRPFQLAMSVGVAHSAPESGESLSRLLMRADAEMYRVKERRGVGR